MNMQNDIAATATTGFRLAEPRVDSAARKAELDALVTLANARRRGMRSLGAFSVVPARPDDDYGCPTQIRAARVSGFKGCEFRFDMAKHHFCASDIEECAERLLEEAAAFCRLRDLKQYIDLVKDMISDTIAPTADCLSPMKLIGIGIEIDVKNNETGLVVDLERLGRDLTPGIDWIAGWDVEELERNLAKSVTSHLERAKLRTVAAASRAIGWIDDAALNILDASGMSRSEAIALLREKRFIEFYFEGEDGFDHFAALYWEDGVIRGEVDGTAFDWRFMRDHLTMLNPGLPETVLAAWAGRRFGDVVDNRFVPADAIVTRVQTSGEWVYVDLVIGQCPVDAAAGQPRSDSIL